MVWDDASRARAHAEGWDIFDTQGDRQHAPFELCKIDDPMAWEDLGYDTPKFEADAEVWVHVLAGAAAGQAHCIAALNFLREESPAEYEQVHRGPDVTDDMDDDEIAAHNDAMENDPQYRDAVHQGRN